MKPNSAFSGPLTAIRTFMVTNGQNLPLHTRKPPGSASTQGEIKDTVADLDMGFNLGSTKARTVWSGELKRFFFESPVVHLMSDHDYDDVFVDGEDLIAVERSERPVSYRCVIIYRYFDEASEAFGTGEPPPAGHFARGLDKLILHLRDKIRMQAAGIVQRGIFVLTGEQKE